MCGIVSRIHHICHYNSDLEENCPDEDCIVKKDDAPVMTDKMKCDTGDCCAGLCTGAGLARECQDDDPQGVPAGRVHGNREGSALAAVAPPSEKILDSKMRDRIKKELFGPLLKKEIVEMYQGGECETVH